MPVPTAIAASRISPRRLKPVVAVKGRISGRFSVGAGGLYHRSRRRQPCAASVTLSWPQLSLPRRGGVGDFGDQLLDKGLAEGIEILCLEHEGARPADNIVAVVIGQAPGRVGVLRVPRQRGLA